MSIGTHRDPGTLSRTARVLVMVATMVATAIAVSDLAITPAADYMYELYGDMASFVLAGPSLMLVIATVPGANMVFFCCVATVLPLVGMACAIVFLVFGGGKHQL